MAKKKTAVRKAKTKTVRKTKTKPKVGKCPHCGATPGIYPGPAPEGYYWKDFGGGGWLPVDKDGNICPGY